MTGKDKRDLIARSHLLKPVVAIAGDDVTATTVAHIRDCFKRQDLLKVRVQADSSAVCDAVGAALVDQVPCQLVRRVGRILILYRPAEDAPAS